MERGQDNTMRKSIYQKGLPETVLFISGLRYRDYLHMSFLEYKVIWQKQFFQSRGSRSAVCLQAIEHHCMVRTGDFAYSFF